MTTTYEIRLIDPGTVIDYQFDWNTSDPDPDGKRGPWLQAGEVITDHTLTPTAGITVDDSEEAGGVVTFWVSHATLGTYPKVTCHIVTNQGREENRTMRFQVVER